MIKNGKIIKCKICLKDFYISFSRFKTKKYCSKECAKKDNFGFSPKLKVCCICGEKFLIKIGIKINKKTCSAHCHYELVKKISLQRSLRKKFRKCQKCLKEFEALFFNVQGKYCKSCQYQIMSEERINERNPNYRGGLWSRNGLYKKEPKRAHLHNRACAKYRKHFLKENEYLFCEICKTNTSIQFSTHHIYFASRFPLHPELHNFRNLILVCLECHSKFHAEKYQEVFLQLEKERNLKSLFSIIE